MLSGSGFFWLHVPMSNFHNNKQTGPRLQHCIQFFFSSLYIQVPSSLIQREMVCWRRDNRKYFRILGRILIQLLVFRRDLIFAHSYFALLCPSLPVRLSSVAEDAIRAYFDSRLVLMEPIFPMACHRLCEGPDFSMEFGFKSQPQPEGKTPLSLELYIF